MKLQKWTPPLRNGACNFWLYAGWAEINQCLLTEILYAFLFNAIQVYPTTTSIVETEFVFNLQRAVFL